MVLFSPEAIVPNVNILEPFRELTGTPSKREAESIKVKPSGTSATNSRFANAMAEIFLIRVLTKVAVPLDILGFEREASKAMGNFEMVPTVGQAFADEIFRVFKSRYPNINIASTNMNEAVRFMIERVGK